MLRREFAQGEIYLVDFGTNSVGHEYQKRRPAVVVQSSEQLARTSLVTVMPITSQINHKMIDDILISKDGENLLLENSLVKVYDIMSFDPQRFFYKIGEASEHVLKAIKIYIKRHFGLS